MYRYSLGGIRIPASPKLPWPSTLAPHAPRLELLLKEVESEFDGYESDDFDRNGNSETFELIENATNRDDAFQLIENATSRRNDNDSYIGLGARPKQPPAWPKPPAVPEPSRLQQRLKKAGRNEVERQHCAFNDCFGTKHNGSTFKPRSWAPGSSRLDQLLQQAEAEFNGYTSDELDQHNSSEDYEFLPIEPSQITPSSRAVLDLDRIEEDAITENGEDTFHNLNQAINDSSDTRSVVLGDDAGLDNSSDPNADVQVPFVGFNMDYIPLVCFDNSVWSFNSANSQCDEASWQSRSCSCRHSEEETDTEDDTEDDSESEDEFTIGDEEEVEEQVEQLLTYDDHEVPVYYNKGLDSVVIQVTLLRKLFCRISLNGF